MNSKFSHWLWSENLSKKKKGVDWVLKAFLRIVVIIAIGFNKHKLELRASALTYTVILSLVPVLAMGTALVKGLGADNYMKEAAYRMLEELEEISSSKPLEDDKSLCAVNGTGEIKSRTSPVLKSVQAKHLKKAIDKIFDYVDKTNFAALGWLGIVASLLTIVSLMSHIEEAMNTIWQTRRTREIGRKVIDYIALIVLLPLSVNVAFWAITATQNESFIESIAATLKISWLLTLIFKFLPFFLIIGTFTILYRFMPNTWVRVGPAFVGGLIGGAGWIAVQTLYIKLQIGVARYNAIYGSFATLPLFIFWLYIGWIVFLIGAEASYAIQNYKRLKPIKRPLSPIKKLGLAIDIMELAYKQHDTGKTITPDFLADELGHPLTEIDGVLERLIAEGFLVPTERHEEYLPAISRRNLDFSRLFESLCGAPSHFKSYGDVVTTRLYEFNLEKIEELKRDRDYYVRDVKEL